jgi:hypothetical protein
MVRVESKDPYGQPRTDRTRCGVHCYAPASTPCLLGTTPVFGIVADGLFPPTPPWLTTTFHFLLSDEADAETSCERHTTAALEADANSVEALNCLANLRLCQQRPEDAQATVTRALAILKAAGEWLTAPALVPSLLQLWSRFVGQHCLECVLLTSFRQMRTRYPRIP